MNEPLDPAEQPGNIEESGELQNRIDQLNGENSQLRLAMRRLSVFQEKLQSLRSQDSIEDALDMMETLLEDVVEFTFMRLYSAKSEATMDRHLVREFCPQEYIIDWTLAEWALSNHELSLIPLSDEEEKSDDDINSLIILPMVGHREEVGVIFLWGEFDHNTFTPEHGYLLNMLARETASVIEQIMLRQSLEVARQELSDVVENIPMGVMAIDPRERITLINGTAEFIFHVSRNNALGKSLSNLLPAHTYAQLRSQLNGQRRDGELELKLSNQVDEVFGVSIAPMHMNAKLKKMHMESEGLENAPPPGNVIVCRDLKLSQEVAKLRELDSMKNDFLSLVSHELRTPLTSIMAYSETLLMEGMIETEEERQEYIEIIYKEGERLSRLINDVLDLTKMEAGKLEFHYQSLDVKETIISAMNSVHSLATQKNQKMPVEIPDDIPAAHADGDRITQVLTNLYSNAIKFTPENGTITTRACASEDSSVGNGACVEVSVTDTGIGIAPEDIHKVFSKFEMVEKIDHHSSGTGLGMPICKQIIEEGHGGKIWIESTPGKGTTFFFRIPRA